MATNREQVGKALELTRDGLRPFVERCLRRAPGGLGQVQVLLQGTEYAENEDPLSDIAAIIRLMLMSRTWYDVFQPNLKRTARAEVRNLVGEVQSVRNRWAHLESFSDDDTERALDTVQRLLKDINANQADKAGQMLMRYRTAKAEGTASEVDTPAPSEVPQTVPRRHQVAEPAPPPVDDVSTPETTSDDADAFTKAAVREIDNLRSQIAAKRAEREGLGVRRDYLEEDQARIVREFEENKRRISGEIASVEAERRKADAEIQSIEARLSRVQAVLEPAPSQPLTAVGEQVVEPIGNSLNELPITASAPDPFRSSERRSSSRSRGRVSTTTADLVCELLAEVGKPLHLREIYARLESREPNPPRTRKKEPAIAYLARYFNDERLVRVRRGTYALKETGSEPAPSADPRPRARDTRPVPPGPGYRGKTPIAYTLLGERREVRSFKQILVEVCEAIWGRSPTEFEQVLDLRGRKRPQFSRNAGDLRTPGQVGRSGIFVETNESADRIFERCQQVLSLFGIDPREFTIEAR